MLKVQRLASISQWNTLYIIIKCILIVFGLEIVIFCVSLYIKQRLHYMGGGYSHVYVHGMSGGQCQLCIPLTLVTFGETDHHPFMLIMLQGSRWYVILFNPQCCGGVVLESCSSSGLLTAVTPPTSLTQISCIGLFVQERDMMYQQVSHHVILKYTSSKLIWISI